MQCKQCNYRLWNLSSRHCPECSATFTPSDYLFKPNRVEFCCPHCMHVYLGSDAQGQPAPIDFDCTQCGKHIHMDDMLLRPVNPKEEALIAFEPNPWTLRHKIGTPTAWLHTIKLSMFGQQQLMDGTPAQGRTSDALAFACINMLIACVGSIGLPFLFVMVIDLTAGHVNAVMDNLLRLLAFIAGATAVWACQALCVHGLLKITGGTQHNLACTFKAMAYTTGPWIWLAIPCLNVVLLAPVMFWYYIGTSHALMRMQQVHPVRALLSQLALPLCLLAIWVRVTIF